MIGRIDTVTASDFRKTVSSVDFDSVDSLEMDFTDLSYISSAGLRELLSLKKTSVSSHSRNFCPAKQLILLIKRSWQPKE
ncbi:MAG: STAS domain-containing protein [Saccharofermentans sp.]|nr:STAS domain-containing protein [Saccharofermentans sp.]